MDVVRHISASSNDKFHTPGWLWIRAPSFLHSQKGYLQSQRLRQMLCQYSSCSQATTSEFFCEQHVDVNAATACPLQGKIGGKQIFGIPMAMSSWRTKVSPLVRLTRQGFGDGKSLSLRTSPYTPALDRWIIEQYFRNSGWRILALAGGMMCCQQLCKTCLLRLSRHRYVAIESKSGAAKLIAERRRVAKTWLLGNARTGW